MPEPEPLGVKICGLTRREDAEAADAHGADFVGVVLSAGFGRSVDPTRARALIDGLTAVPVAVLVDEPADRAAAIADALGAGVVQLHGGELPEEVEALRALGGWKIWKVVRAATPSDVEHAVARYGSLVDGLLVEGRREGIVGGGGARLDPRTFGPLRRLLPPSLDLVVAGGLTPDTVAEAVDRFSPDVVDVSSGVEGAPGVKSPELIRRFIQEARAAARRASGTHPHRGARS